MNTTTTRRLFATVAISTALSLPTPCWAATATLPWDYTLLALQDIVVHTIAPAAIGFAFISSVVLYALGGHDEQAGRLIGSGLGGLIALAIVYLLNYVLP